MHIREKPINICRKCSKCYNSFRDTSAVRTSLFYPFSCRWRNSLLEVVELGNLFFSMETCSGSASWCSAELPYPALPWIEILKAKLIWNEFSTCHCTTPKAANPAVVTCRLQIFWKMWFKQQEFHQNQRGLRFCCESSTWFWLQRRKIFPLWLPWLGFLVTKSPRQRRKGMPSALWGP